MLLECYCYATTPQEEGFDLCFVSVFVVGCVVCVVCLCVVLWPVFAWGRLAHRSHNGVNEKLPNTTGPQSEGLVVHVT